MKSKSSAKPTDLSSHFATVESNAHKELNIDEARACSNSVDVAQGMIDVIFGKFEEDVRDKRLETIRLKFAMLHTKQTVNRAFEDCVVNMDCRHDDYLLEDKIVQDNDTEPKPCCPD